jgi:[ribosomal protein S18]-alanine N-acetyltransferase
MGATRCPVALQLRPLQWADLEQVIEIEAGAYSHPWTRGNFQDSLLAGHPTCALSDTEDGLVGYSVAMPGVEELHLLNLTVARHRQRRGLGARLLLAVIDQARELRLQTVWLEVRASNFPAVALYRQFGFEQVGLRRGYYPARSGREDAVLMSLVLRGRHEAG